ncbi:MAG: hypothetical protein KKA79_07085 [Nanoarchaeota archaeon]|nr:hypothetical protein [Nanoarchaeota archaeon]
MENNDVTYIYQFIGYSLTMAGFTLLGGIFEKKKHQDIEIKLFESSKFFILAALLFMSGMALVAIGGYTAVKYINPWYFTTLAAISLIIGQIIFVIGFLHLVRYLMMYRPTQDKL